MYPITVNTEADYQAIIDIGFCPLLDWKRFNLNIHLRIQIQNQIFGRAVFSKGNIPQANQRFYAYCWENAPIKCCEECQKPLYDYAAIFISHILTKGAHPEMAHDPRNYNILCAKCHDTWESFVDRDKMKIRKRNNRVIKILFNDYSNLRA